MEEAPGKELDDVENGVFLSFVRDFEGFELGVKRSSRLGWWRGGSREICFWDCDLGIVSGLVTGFGRFRVWRWKFAGYGEGYGIS